MEPCSADCRYNPLVCCQMMELEYPPELLLAGSLSWTQKSRAKEFDAYCITIHNWWYCWFLLSCRISLNSHDSLAHHQHVHCMHQINGVVVVCRGAPSSATLQEHTAACRSWLLSKSSYCMIKPVCALLPTCFLLPLCKVPIKNMHLPFQQHWIVVPPQCNGWRTFLKLVIKTPTTWHSRSCCNFVFSQEQHSKVLLVSTSKKDVSTRFFSYCWKKLRLGPQLHASYHIWYDAFLLIQVYHMVIAFLVVTLDSVLWRCSNIQLEDYSML